MTDGVQVQLKGDRAIVAEFTQLKDYLPKQFLRTAVRKGAQRMYDAVYPHLPFKSGRLVANTSVATHKTANTIRARLIISTRGARDSITNSFYWIFLERGWRTKNGVLHKHEFALKAIEATAQAAAQDCVDAVDAALAKAEQTARSNRGF